MKTQIISSLMTLWLFLAAAFAPSTLLGQLSTHNIALLNFIYPPRLSFLKSPFLAAAAPTMPLEETSVDNTGSTIGFGLIISNGETLPISNDEPSIYFSDDALSDLGNRLWTTYSPEKKVVIWDERGFACIGIAQCLWNPVGTTSSFGEDWPATARFLKNHGIAIEEWMLGPCPWSTEKEFNDALQNDPRLQRLITLLSTPAAITEQAHCIVENFKQAFSPISESSILKNLPPGEAKLLAAYFWAVSHCYGDNCKPLGLFALIDYVHYKGEGLGGGYNTQSWGLQRVLWNMQNVDPEFVHTHTALETFIVSAKQVLEERITNYRIERDRNNTPVTNDKPNANFDEAQYRKLWHDHLDAYLSWPQEFNNDLE
ncbi:MAG: hypothetical protein K2W99_05270 [Chthoniobacterales bacterium]|nr:hypothetical protein [Chthoniobacterales bacterium]